MIYVARQFVRDLARAIAYTLWEMRPCIRIRSVSITTTYSIYLCVVISMFVDVINIDDNFCDSKAT